MAFDSREVEPGHLFVAMKGEATDGHLFLDKAFAAGAAGAIVSEETAQPHVRVADTTAALNALGRAARNRTVRPDLRSHRLGRQDRAPRRRSTRRSTAPRPARRTGR